MKHLWVHRDVDAPAPVVWEMIADPAAWGAWGPSVRGAVFHDGGSIRLGATGTVETAFGVRLPFEVTAFEAGRRWAWTVAGIAATDHVVEAIGPQRSRVGFGVPWPAAPYLAMCRVALQRIERLVRQPMVVT